MSTSLDISGHQVYVGKRVNVKWLHEWYEGTVLEIGPQKQLYKVEESITGQTILLHSTQMRLIDTSKPTDKQCGIGAKVAYYDNDLNTLISGVIVNNNVEGMVLAKWQKNSESSENVNWFELSNIAPIIKNEAFGLDKTEVSLPIVPQSDSLANLPEKLHLHRRNELFDESTEIPMPFQNKLPDISQLSEEQDAQYHIKKHRTSVSMKNFYSKNMKNDVLHGEAKLNRYMQNQAALLQGKLDQSLLPVAWNYHSQTKGIPHHPTSKFFLYSRPSLGGRQAPRVHPLTRMNRTYSAGGVQLGLTKSPTLSTEAASEPAPLRSSKSGPILQKSTRQKAKNINALPDIVIEDEVSSPLTSPTAPVIVSTSKSKMLVSAGGTVTLYCEVHSDAPVSYGWRKNGKPLTQNDERVAFPKPGHLQLYGLTMDDAGDYHCVARNEGGSATYTCKLCVENETIKRSFSREYGLDKMTKELLESSNSDKKEYVDRDSVPISAAGTLVTDDGFLSSAPTYDDLPQLLLKPVSQQDKQKQIVLQAKKQAAKQEKKKDKEAKSFTKEISAPMLSSSRKKHKNGQRRVSDTLMEGVNNYLEGYGGTSHVAENHPAKTKAKPKKKETKKSKSLSSFGFAKRKNAKAKNKPLPDEALEQTTPNGDDDDDDDDDYEMQQFKLEVPQLPEIHILEIQDDEMSYTEEQNELDKETLEETGEIAINEMIREEGEGAEEEELAALEPENTDSLDRNKEIIYTTDDFPRDDSVNHWKDTLYGHETLEIDLKGITTCTPKLKKANSEDSINAHASYDNLEIDSEASIEDRLRERGVGRSGNVDLPIEKQDYNEAVFRLQQSHKQYENERFGNGNKITEITMI